MLVEPQLMTIPGVSLPPIGQNETILVALKTETAKNEEIMLRCMLENRPQSGFSQEYLRYFVAVHVMNFDMAEYPFA